MSQQRKTGISEQNDTSRFILIPRWLGIAVLVLLLLACLLLLMLWKPWYPAQRPTPVENAKSEQVEMQEKPTDYQFYDLLPQQKVTPLPSKSLEPPKTEIKPANEPKPTEQQPSTTNAPAKPVAETAKPPVQATIQSSEQENLRFILNIQRFDNADDAEQLRDKIVQAGASAEVSVHIENDKVWYRVLSGPYESKAEVNAAQKRLNEYGIASTVSSIRGR